MKIVFGEYRTNPKAGCGAQGYAAVRSRKMIVCTGSGLFAAGRDAMIADQGYLKNIPLPFSGK